MRRRTGEFEVDGLPVGWVRDGSLSGRPLVMLAHGAGAPFTSDFMEAVTEGLLGRGLAVTRFHFPYMEQSVREGRRRPPDRAPRLLAAWRAMLDVTARWSTKGPVVMGGKSLGARMASLLLAEGRAPEAHGVFYLGYPLHPSGQPERLRDAHLSDVPVPQLFVSGTKDPLARLDLLRPVVDRLGQGARLHLVEGGDHSLARSRKAPLEGAEDWLDAVAYFVRKVT